MLQQQVGVQQQIVEVEGIGRAQALLEPRVHLGGHAPHRVGGPTLEITGHDEVVLRARDAVHELVDRKALRVDVQLGHDVLIQALHVVHIVDGEALREAQAIGIGPQDTHAHGVEGGHPHAPGSAADELGQTLAHLSRRLVGEGDGQNLPGRRQVLLQDVGDAVGKNAGLAASGAGQHEQRALGGDNRLALRLVQGIDIDGHRSVL